jgi:hypothetical protein
VTNIRAPADHRAFLLDVQQSVMSMPSAKTIVVALFFAIGGGSARRNCGFRRLRPRIPIERGHAFRSKAATCSDEGGRGVVVGMRSWVRFS